MYGELAAEMHLDFLLVRTYVYMKLFESARCDGGWVSGRERKRRKGYMKAVQNARGWVEGRRDFFMDGWMDGLIFEAWSYVAVGRGGVRVDKNLGFAGTSWFHWALGIAHAEKPPASKGK